MTDLQTAVNGLNGHTICLCKDGKCLFSDERGILPMMNFIASGVDLTGYSVADVVVGKAAALLFAKSNVSFVFAKVLSEDGKKTLELNGIKYEYETLTKNIINRTGTDVCPMEKAVANVLNPNDGYELLKNRLNKK